MNELVEDLARWERGEIGVDEMISVHPDAGAIELAEMHTLIAMLTAEPERERGPSWQQLVAILPPQEPPPPDPTSKPKPKPKRLPVGRIVAALLAGAVAAPATAAAGGIDIVDHFTQGVANIDPFLSSGSEQPVLPEPPTPASTSAELPGRVPVAPPPAPPVIEPVTAPPVPTASPDVNALEPPVEAPLAPPPEATATLNPPETTVPSALPAPPAPQVDDAVAPDPPQADHGHAATTHGAGTRHDPKGNESKDKGGRGKGQSDPPGPPQD